MKLIIVILCIWLITAPIVGYYEPYLFRLIYSITMVLLSFLIYNTFNSVLIWIPFLLSVPLLFSCSITLFLPSVKELADQVGLVSVLTGITLALIKIHYTYARRI